MAVARSVAVPIAFRSWNGSRNASTLLEMSEFRVLGSLDLAGEGGEKVLTVPAETKRAAGRRLPCSPTLLGRARRRAELPGDRAARALVVLSLPPVLGSAEERTAAPGGLAADRFDI